MSFDFSDVEFFVEPIELNPITPVKALSKSESSAIANHFALTNFWVQNFECGLIDASVAYEEIFG